MNDEAIKRWIKARIEMVQNEVMLQVHKYDEGVITKEDLADAVRHSISTNATTIYDTGFKDGVEGSVDAEDEDDDITFIIEEDDYDEEDDDEDSPPDAR